MSHSIRILDFVRGETETIGKLNSSGRVLLYRDREHGSNQRETAISSPVWKCAVLGLPHELSQEVNIFHLTIFCTMLRNLSAKLSSILMLSYGNKFRTILTHCYLSYRILPYFSSHMPPKYHLSTSSLITGQWQFVCSRVAMKQQLLQQRHLQLQGQNQKLLVQNTLQNIVITTNA